MRTFHRGRCVAVTTQRVFRGRAFLTSVFASCRPRASANNQRFIIFAKPASKIQNRLFIVKAEFQGKPQNASAKTSGLGRGEEVRVGVRKIAFALGLCTQRPTLISAVVTCGGSDQFLD